MSATISPPADPADPAVAEGFVDRRRLQPPAQSVGRERRQFTNSHDDLTPEAAELARAIDLYKLQHRRRFINFEEMLAIVKGLGYQR